MNLNKEYDFLEDSTIYKATIAILNVGAHVTSMTFSQYRQASLDSMCLPLAKYQTW